MTDEIPEEDLDETGDPSVPSDLLELHVELEVAGCTADEFKEFVDADCD